MIQAALRLGGFLSGLANYRQFLIYKIVPGLPKAKKFPVSPLTGQVCDAHDESHWVDSETAIAAAEAWGFSGQVAFVLSDADPFFFIDIDGAYADGAWSPTATALCARFAGAAVEVSSSLTGLHILGYASSVPLHGCKNIKQHLELYTTKRFIALTGLSGQGDVMQYDWAQNLPALVDEFFPPTPESAPMPEGRLPEWSGPEDDVSLLQRMLASAPSAGASFGSRATLAELWSADADALARVYPSDAGGYDASSADLALAMHLAWWTGNDAPRIERMMRQSALRRDKWDTHATYLAQFTIVQAISTNGSKCYVERAPLENPLLTNAVAATVNDQPAIEGDDHMPPQVHGAIRYLEIDEQIKYFKNCIYVKEHDAVLAPNGMLLNQSRFDSAYGGYIFKLDASNSTVSKKPWDAFTRSLAFNAPQVDRTFFNPNLPPRAIRHEHGVQSVNIWRPKYGKQTLGDVAPFLEHIQRLLPDVQDQRILISYLAACVQHVGVKFKWSIVIQGVEGNGKSMIVRMMEHALGTDYVYSPRGHQLGGKFNGWMDGKLLIVVEDFKSDMNKQEELMEILKPMITEPVMEIEGKGTNAQKVPVFCNYLFTTNHKDGLRKSKNDRRYCVFFTDQQEENDLAQQGMTAVYFRKLNNWLDEGGYEHVSAYLATVTIPDELNPATDCIRAPRTSKYAEVIESGLSGQALMLRDAMEEGVAGIQGGYLSSIVIKRVMSEGGMRSFGPKAMNRICHELGYIRHPALYQGRTPRTTSWDNGRTCLYILRDHISLQLVDTDLIMRDYEARQGGKQLPVPASVIAFRP
jgi:hypothetical protein